MSVKGVSRRSANGFMNIIADVHGGGILPPRHADGLLPLTFRQKIPANFDGITGDDVRQSTATSRVPLHERKHPVGDYHGV